MDRLPVFSVGSQPRSIHRVRGGGLIYEEPKSKRSQRTLALPLPLLAELHRHSAAQLGERMLAGSEWHDEDLVFAQPNGRPIDKKTDYDDWTRLLQKAGVRHVRLHDGRHTAATLLLSENVHPRVVMELLGHSQMRTTMDIYSHVMPALAREAADRMGTLLLPSGAGPTATTDDPGRPPGGERPGHRGGAEGTRTPDPHTASVVRYQLRHSPLPDPGGVPRAADNSTGPRRRSDAGGQGGSALLHLGDADVVAERVAQAEVDAVGLVDRLLGDLHALRLQLGMGLVGVVAAQEQVSAGCTLREQVAHLRGGLSAHGRRTGDLQQDPAGGVTGDVDGEPAHEAEVHVLPDLHAELADVEVQGLVL